MKLFAAWREMYCVSEIGLNFYNGPSCSQQRRNSWKIFWQQWRYTLFYMSIAQLQNEKAVVETTIHIEHTIKIYAVTESQWKGSLSFQLLDLKLDFCKLAKNTCTYETVKLILVNYLFYWECHHFDHFPDFKTCMHCQNYYGAVIMIFVLLSQDFLSAKI